MNFSYDDGILHITLPEKINAENAADFEKELFAIDQLPYAKEIVFDANNLKYISSLGLRVIFKLTKEFAMLKVQELRRNLFPSSQLQKA